MVAVAEKSQVTEERGRKEPPSYYVTRAMFNKLCEELDNKRAKESTIVLEIRSASNHKPDRLDSARVALQETSSFNQERIRALEDLIRRAEIVDSGSFAINLECVSPGTQVTVQYPTGEISSFTMLSMTNSGLETLSIESPVGQALMGRLPGETVYAQTPQETQCLTITNIGLPDFLSLQSGMTGPAGIAAK